MLEEGSKPRRNSENAKCRSSHKESEGGKKSSVARKTSLEPHSGKRDNKFMSYQKRGRSASEKRRDSVNQDIDCP